MSLMIPLSMHFRWVPIKRNDWYWIRHHIKVGMDVIVEILVSDAWYFLNFCSSKSSIWISSQYHNHLTNKLVLICNISTLFCWGPCCIMHSSSMILLLFGFSMNLEWSVLFGYQITDFAYSHMYSEVFRNVADIMLY